MLNTHDALLRNADDIPAEAAFVGVSDLSLMGEFVGSAAFVDHYGTFRRGQDLGLDVIFGFDDEQVASRSVRAAVVFMPKSREELKMRLELAANLAPGGQCWLVGAKREGIAGGSKLFAARFSSAMKVDSARHCQVWVGDVEDSTKPFRLADWMSWHSIERCGTELSVAGLPGIFSDGRLDDGTAMLLDSLSAYPVSEGPILDFACGAGVIMGWLGCQGATHLDGVDVQSQAISCARATLERAGISGRIWPSDSLSKVSGRYQTIVSNPPFHRGVATDTSATDQFLDGCRQHLVRGGELRLVANRFLHYPEILRRHFGQFDVLTEDKRFVVYRAVQGR